MPDWENFKEKYPVGSRVSGRIAHKAPFGVFLAFGSSFTVILNITEMLELNYQLYMEHQQFNPGERTWGYVTGFHESAKQATISQKKLIR